MHYLLYAVRTSLVTMILICSVQYVSSQNLTDRDLKINITPIENSLQQIVALNPASFEYNNLRYSHLKLPNGTHYGFITEDFQKIFPGLVYKKQYSYMAGKNSFRNATLKTISLEGLIPVLIASIKEQQEQIDELKSEVERLKK